MYYNVDWEDNENQTIQCWGFQVYLSIILVYHAQSLHSNKVKILINTNTVETV